MAADQTNKLCSAVICKYDKYYEHVQMDVYNITRLAMRFCELLQLEEVVHAPQRPDN